MNDPSQQSSAIGTACGELAISLEQVAALYEHCPVAYWLVHQNQIIYANPASLSLLGAKHREQILGRAFVELLPAALSAQIQGCISNVQDSLTTPRTAEGQLTRFDGTKLTAKVSSWPVELTTGLAVQIMLAEIESRHSTGGFLRFGDERFRESFALDTIEVFREAESRARARSDELAAILDSVPALTFIAHDPECRKMTSSRVAHEFLQIPSGGNTSKTAPEDERPKTFRAMRGDIEIPGEELPVQVAARTGREVRNAELTLLFEDGTRREIFGHAVPLFNNQSQVRGAVGAFIDITELKWAEELLRLTTGRFETALRESRIVVFSQDLDLRYTWIYNPALGYESSQVIGKLDSDVFERPQDAAATEALKREVIRSGKGQRKEVLVHDRGIDRIYDLQVDPLLDTNGKIAGVTCAAIDITELKKSEKRLRASEERLRLAQQVARIGSFEWNIQTNVNQWSPELEALYGLGHGEFAGTFEAWAARVHSDDLPKVMVHVRESLLTGLVDTQWRAVLPDGSIRWLAARAHVFKDESGAPLRMVGVNLDITEQKRAEEDLRVQGELLRKTEKLAAAGELASSIAHEVNNPLAAVTNLLYLLETDDQLEPAAKQLVSTAASELARVSRIVKQSLSYYRVGRAPELVDVGKLVDESLQVFEGKFVHAGIQVRRDIEPKTQVFGFANELRQVIDNLILNAVDAMPGGGCLRVSVQHSREWTKTNRGGARLTISDNGCGIKKESLQYIFQPFFTTKSEKGTGLGMWVAHGVVSKHEGTIRVRSSQHGDRCGTTVTVYLPAQDQSSLAPAKARKG